MKQPFKTMYFEEGDKKFSPKCWLLSKILLAVAVQTIILYTCTDMKYQFSFSGGGSVPVS